MTDLLPARPPGNAFGAFIGLGVFTAFSGSSSGK